MTTGTFNAKIAHTGCYVEIENEKGGKEEKYLWLKVKAQVPENGNPDDYEDTSIMRIVAPKGTAVKHLVEKCEMMLLQSGVRMTIMAMADKMQEQEEAEKRATKVIKQEFGIIKD